MIKEILKHSQVDPDVLAAREAVRGQVKSIKWNMDPLMRNVVEVEGQAAIDREKLLKLRAEARQVVQKLLYDRHPQRSEN